MHLLKDKSRSAKFHEVYLSKKTVQEQGNTPYQICFQMTHPIPASHSKRSNIQKTTWLVSFAFTFYGQDLTASNLYLARSSTARIDWVGFLVTKV